MKKRSITILKVSIVIILLVLLIALLLGVLLKDKTEAISTTSTSKDGVQCYLEYNLGTATISEFDVDITSTSYRGFYVSASWTYFTLELPAGYQWLANTFSLKQASVGGYSSLESAVSAAATNLDSTSQTIIATRNENIFSFTFDYFWDSMGPTMDGTSLCHALALRLELQNGVDFVAGESLNVNTSIFNNIGGTVETDSDEYFENQSVVATAEPDEGYVFDHWLLNGQTYLENPLTFTITEDSLLIAFFKEPSNVTVTIRDNIICDVREITTDTDCFVVVTPPAGQYVNSFVIDGMTFSVQYYHANVYGAGEAHLIHYTARDTSNTFSIYFEQLFGTSSLEIVLATVAPNYQTPPLGGASIEGVATQATNGGEARITGIDTTEENATVHVSAVCYNGYAFAGWTASDGTDLSSYGISADIPFDLIEGKVITANFVPNSQAQGNNTNDDLDNIGSEFG